MYIRNVVEIEIELPDEKEHTKMVQWADKHGYLNNNWNSFLFVDKVLREQCPPEIRKVIADFENVDYWLIHFCFVEE